MAAVGRSPQADPPTGGQIIFPPKHKNPKPFNPANKERLRPNSNSRALPPKGRRQIYTNLSITLLTPSTQPAIEAIHDLQDGKSRPFGLLTRDSSYCDCSRLARFRVESIRTLRRLFISPRPAKRKKASATEPVMADFGDMAGSVRSPGDLFRQVGARPRVLPPCFFQEHEGNRPGD